MRLVSIGIHVHAQPARLKATLVSVRAHTTEPVDLLLLPDGPDGETGACLRALPGIAQYGSETPLGAPACFNRLAAAGRGEVLVLLESGCIVGPGWLDQLLAALDADPRHGLAGPSTNTSWNEQGLFPRAAGSPAEVERTAALARQRGAGVWRTLEPLHSLADFCFAVKREVVDAVGAADQSYGLGPCWEMDYNIRAARAGFQGVWACGAYVWRAPPTPRRRQEERRSFQANKQRYQDKFCALRLHGQRGDYETHCRGDACEHFAPPALIQIHEVLPAVQPAPAGRPAAGDPPDAAAVQEAVARAPAVRVASPGAAPLVTCIMPTGNRADYVLQSVHYLQRQDHANWELIIVDDGSDDLAGRLPADPRIRHQQVRRGLSIGAKRNHACELARGEIVVQWDDDDWYGPARLSRQIAPLLAGEADITALDDTIFFEPDKWAFWRCSPELHRRLFVEDVHGGTLAFRRRVWRDLGRYPDRSLAEDAWFLRQTMRRGARLGRLSGDGLFLYLRHGDNAWTFACGQFLDPGGWQRIDEPLYLQADRAFYAAEAPESSPPSAQPASSSPLVTCIMPTANRRQFVDQAIRYFLRQDYANRELVVIDDGDDPVADLAAGHPQIRYQHLSSRRSVGAKRNLACQQAQGEIIVHWDDDDWSAPRRLSYQVGALLAENADINGLSVINYYSPQLGHAWQYVYPPRADAWVAGNTLCYRRSYWRSNPFADIDVGEDSRFVRARASRRLAVLPDATFFVATIHGDNVSPKRPHGERWQPLPAAEVEALLGDDLAFYKRLGQAA
ncbi:MAG: glycosyltransferase [Caldilineales bacterium]